jgi:hypothetical protein
VLHQKGHFVEYEIIDAVGLDDGAGCVNAAYRTPTTTQEITFYALIMNRAFQSMPGQKRPFIVMNMMLANRFDQRGAPIFDTTEMVTLGDAVLYRNDADTQPDVGEARYFDEGAKMRILAGIVRAVDPESVNVHQGREKAYRIRALGLGANVKTFRKLYAKLQKFMLGHFVFWLNGTTYYVDIESVVVQSQPSAAELYLRQTSDFDFDGVSYLINDLGTWTWDVLPFINGVLDEDRATMVPVGIHYLRQRLREQLEPRFPELEIQVRDLEALLMSPSPTVLYQGSRIDVGAAVASARMTSWREGLRQLAPTLRGQQYQRSFFVGGGANVYAPTIHQVYQNMPGLYEVVPRAHMTVAWGLYYAAKDSLGEPLIPAKVTSSGKKRSPIA